ncbi:MAG: 4-(cytidine 5'-diphospho)-2-C-methyl-D-erythritol kinase [Cyclobacteriaceae bacterium]
MISFPNAKINLGLNILNKRPDGYHDIESCFYPVGWQDGLEIMPAGKFSFQSHGIPIPGSRDGNLCISAYELLKSDFNLPPVSIYLLKNIPIGAGLGGGSADCAFTFRVLRDIFNLKLTDTELENYAASLGSDCPFFIKNQPVLATGTGIELTPVELSLRGYYLILIHPGIHISTAEAYAGVTPHQPEQTVKSIINRYQPTEWKSYLKNDFENSVFPKYPLLKEIKEQFYHSGALYSSMTGSGSAIFALFDHEVVNPFPQYKAHEGYL